MLCNAHGQCNQILQKLGVGVYNNENHDFQYVGLPSQTSRTNNKRVISTFKFGYPHLTLKEGSKVKSDHTKRFPVHDYLWVGLPTKTSRTNNKGDIITFLD